MWCQVKSNKVMSKDFSHGNFNYQTVQYHMQHLQGETLTIIEASIPDGKQQKAVKDIFNDRFSRTLERISKLDGASEDGSQQSIK